MQPPLIAIDGPAASGKSTTAVAVARRLGLPCLDTGALYRAAAWMVLDRGIPPDLAAAVTRLVLDAKFTFAEAGEGTRVWVDDREVTGQLRAPEVTRAVTPVCEIPEVRRRLVDLQRRWVLRGFGIMEGRDIGTVVLPDAGLKIFLNARPEVRARRRAIQLDCADDEEKIREIAVQITERDRRDAQRQDSPLVKAADAVEVDTSDLTFSRQVNCIIALAAERFGTRLYGATTTPR